MEDDNLKDSIITKDNDEGDDNTKQAAPKSSMNAIMFGMMASSMGTGIFNLPLRVTEVGLLFFIGYVIAGGLFSFLGANMLQLMIKKKGSNSYSDLSNQAIGWVLKRVSQFCLILFPWGICICFQVIMAKFAVQLMADFLNCNFYQDRDAQIYNSQGNLVRILINIVVILINFVLISAKDLSKIQKFAMVSVAAVVYNTIVIFVLFLIGFHHDGPNLDYGGLFHLDWSLVKWAIFPGGQTFSMHTQAIASIIFCYVNHQLVFNACSNMEDPTSPRLRTVFLRTNVNQLIAYLFIGCSGYLLLVEHEDIEPIGPMVLTTITVWPMALGKLFMIFSLFFSIPLNMFPARAILFQTLALQKTNKNHYILSIILAVLSCVIAISFQKVNAYFGLLGGTCGVFMAGTIPALCYYKLIMCENEEEKGSVKNILKLVFCIVITLLGVCGAILSVIDPA